jgi:nicotinamidase-related amidase
MRSAQDVVKADEAVLVLVDVQDGLARAMPPEDRWLESAALLARAAGPLGMPCIVTRQYPQGLGDTVRAVAEAVGPHVPVDKMTFDSMAERGFCERLEATGRRTVVIAGIEAHICVTQTALSLARTGHRVHVVADAVCSRRPGDRETALARLRSAGVVVTTSESVLYEALERAGTQTFRDVLRLVKECRPAR